MTKLRIVCATAALAATASGTALADASANVGLMSDYIFRGVYQAESVAFGGLDIEADNGFYIGTWAANVKDGLEYDVYLGYGGGGENFSWYAGLTGYYYSDEFDNTYEELNLGISFGFLSIDYALGDYTYNASNYFAGNWPYEPYDVNWEEKQTYQYVGATFAPEVGPYYFIGYTNYSSISRNDCGVVFTDPLAMTSSIPFDCDGPAPFTGRDGIWIEIGKSFEVMEDLEFSITGLFSPDVRQEIPPNPSSSIVLNANDPTSEFALTFSLTKTLRFNN